MITESNMRKLLLSLTSISFLILVLSIRFSKLFTHELKPEPSKMANTEERTYIMIKPDGVQRGLVGEIIKRFEQRGYHLAGLKLVQVRLNTKLKPYF
jgi:hypothetical protein